MVAVVLVFGSLMASAMFHGLLVSGQSDLDRMDTQIQSGRTALAQEKLDLANLQSPERIAKEAAKLGMVPADQQHWVTPGTDDPPVVTGQADPEADTQTDSTSTSTSTSTSSTDTGTAGTSADELAAADGGGSAQ
jgi:hypothetical protein